MFHKHSTSHQALYDLGQTFNQSYNTNLKLFLSNQTDSVGEVRVTGNSTNALPNARNVSRVLNNRPFHRAAIFSYFMMQFGQFLDHDITHTDLMMVQNDDGKAETSPIILLDRPQLYCINNQFSKNSDLTKLRYSNRLSKMS